MPLPGSLSNSLARTHVTNDDHSFLFGEMISKEAASTADGRIVFPKHLEFTAVRRGEMGLHRRFQGSVILSRVRRRECSRQDGRITGIEHVRCQRESIVRVNIIPLEEERDQRPHVFPQPQQLYTTLIALVIRGQHGKPALWTQAKMYIEQEGVFPTHT